MLQILIELSEDPLASIKPSGENATESTEFQFVSPLKIVKNIFNKYMNFLIIFIIKNMLEDSFWYNNFYKILFKTKYVL